MKIIDQNLLHTLKTSACVLALAGTLMVPSLASYAEDKADLSLEANAQVEQDTQDQTAEKRKEIIAEAVSALSETRSALKALDEEKTKDALSALEKATGKLEIILARDPSLALAPTGVRTETYDIIGSLNDINKIKKDAKSLLGDDKVQAARHLLSGLASEAVIKTTNIPLATYPDAIKKAVKLIDEDKINEAKAVLQTALNTLVVTQKIIPLPVVVAESLLDDAEKLAENEERTEEESERLSDLLGAAETEIQLAQALGYGEKKDFEDFYKEIKTIRSKSFDGKSGLGFFEQIRSFMESMTLFSQPEKQNNN